MCVLTLKSFFLLRYLSDKMLDYVNVTNFKVSYFQTSLFQAPRSIQLLWSEVNGSPSLSITGPGGEDDNFIIRDYTCSIITARSPWTTISTWINAHSSPQQGTVSLYYSNTVPALPHTIPGLWSLEILFIGISEKPWK